jgi:serine-type anaerobic sulfatase-maturating enzyme
MSKPLTSLLVKPAGADCNLACGYCFYLEKAALYPDKRVRRMSEEVLREMIRQAMAQSQSGMSFGWQGGEPTLMGLDFFKKAVEFQQLYGRDGQSVGNGLQTNGILLNEEWAEFMKQYNFLVGLSIDGPEHIHDHYRLKSNGSPTWERVSGVGQMLLAAGVSTNALSVVNDYSVQYAREIYSFHREQGYEFMQFIPCVETDPRHPGRAAPFSVSADDLGHFLCEIFDCWKEDFKDGYPTTNVRWFDSIFHTYVGRTAPECTLLRECGTYLVVEHNGDVYSCDFYVEPQWKLGNLMQDRLKEMLNGERQKCFGLVKTQLPPECPDCRWLPHCYGGCCKDRQRDPLDNGSNHFCKAYIMFFEHADATLREMAENYRRQERLAKLERTGVDLSKVKRNDPCPCGSGKKYKACCM